MLRLRRGGKNTTSAPAPRPAVVSPVDAAAGEELARRTQRRQELADIKSRLHRQLLDRLDLSKFEKDSPDHREQIRMVLVDLVAKEANLLDSRRPERIVVLIAP